MGSLTAECSRQVLTVSVAYLPPKGGIAQVISAFSKIYPVFNHVATSSEGSLPQKSFKLFSAIFKFLYYCIFKNIKIVHVHGASYNSFSRKKIFIFLARLMGKKVVYHVHGAEYKKFYSNNERSVTNLFKKVDLVVALSESWKFFFEDEVGHRNVKVIQNIVSLPVRLAVQEDGLVHFLFLGVLGQRKGIYDLLDAVSEHIGELKGKAVFHIGGNGETQKVKERIVQLRLEGLVVFEGWVSGERKVRLLNQADVYILTSYNEGLPISILEAMAYKLPIISTPVGGIPEVVIQNKNGFLVSPGDKQAIGKAILKMMESKNFRCAAGEVSYSKIQPHFPDNVAEKLEAMYRELLS